jgi:hypothetical protein
MVHPKFSDPRHSSIVSDNNIRVTKVSAYRCSTDTHHPGYPE